MKIISLLENTSERDDVKTEHGLSLYIETNGHRILFDMGQTDLFYENASTLGVDLSLVDLAVLSHGHYDHGGGLRKFLEVNSTAPIYLRKEAFLPYYNGTSKYIGLDPELKDNPRLVFVGDEYAIDSHLSLFSCNNREKSYPPISSGLKEKQGEDFADDLFLHEQYLLVKEGEKQVLFSGCSHKGIFDIVRWFSVDVLVGGFHFSKLALDDRLSDYAKLLAKEPITYFTCHCTGKEQFEFMKKQLPSLKYLSCGKIVII